MASESRNELAWRALCYACGELAADEAAAFEARLASDQVAREALAQAVELAVAVDRVGPAGDRGRWIVRLPGRRTLVGLASAAAACLALVVGLPARPPAPVAREAPGSQPGHVRTLEQDPASVAAALAWSELRRSALEGTSRSDLLAWLEDPAATSAEDTHPEAEADPEAAADVSGWMLAIATLPEPEPAGPSREDP